MDTPSPGWTRTARWLHWGMALAVLLEVPAGFLMAYTYAPPGSANEALHVAASQVHHTLGLLFFAFVLYRLGWRIGHRAPLLPATTGRTQRIAAHLVQVLLYGVMLCLPLTGYAALSSLADVEGFGSTTLWFFGHDGFGPDGMIPRLIQPVPYTSTDLLRYGLFAPAHVYLAYFGCGLLALHILGALHHQLVAKDAVLARMWSSAGR